MKISYIRLRDTMASEEYSITWNQHARNVVGVFGSFLDEEAFVDCTIAAEGEHLKAHRLMLSACSPYFERLFRQELEKDKVVDLEDISYEDLKSMIIFMYQGQIAVPKDRLRDFVRAAEFLQIKGLPSGLLHSLQREATEMSDNSGKEGSASHQSHKRMRRSVVGGETSELQYENLKTSSIGRTQSGNEKSFFCLQTDLSEGNVFSQPHSVLWNDSKRETAVVPADKESSMEPKEEIDVEDNPIWESEDENTNTVTDLYSSAAACGEENRKELSSVPGSVSSYGDATSPILGNKSESTVLSFCSVTPIHSSANSASSSPFVFCIPNDQGNDAIEDSSSRVKRELAAQGVSVKNEPVVKTEVVTAVFSLHSECTVEPMYEEWVEEMRSWEDEEETIGMDTVVMCNQEIRIKDQDVAASDHYHPVVNPNLTITVSTSSCVVAEGEGKEVNAQDVKVEKSEMSSHCMGQESKGIENNDSIVDKMVPSTQHSVVESDENKVEKEDLVMVKTIEGTEMDSAVEQIEAEEEDLAPLSERLSKMLGKELHTSFRCPDVFNTVSDVQVQAKRQQREKRSHECEECKATFVCKSKLLRHMRIHTGERPFECEECGKSFRRKFDLNVHKMTHTGERPFQCSVCKVSFGDRSNLTRHKRTHTGERPFKCDLCRRSFSQCSHLIIHKRTHTGERPFKCDVCGMSCSQSSHLTEHKRTHTGECPFQCDICKRSFSLKHHLIRHLRNHPGERS